MYIIKCAKILKNEDLAKSVKTMKGNWNPGYYRSSEVGVICGNGTLIGAICKNRTWATVFLMKDVDIKTAIYTLLPGRFTSDCGNNDKSAELLETNYIGIVASEPKNKSEKFVKNIINQLKRQYDGEVQGILISKEKIFCKVCGHELEGPIYDKYNRCFNCSTCPCCGMGFLGTEEHDIERVVKNRKEWIKKGTPWFIPELKPTNWSYHKQLENILGKREEKNKIDASCLHKEYQTKEKDGLYAVFYDNGELQHYGKYIGGKIKASLDLEHGIQSGRFETELAYGIYDGGFHDCYNMWNDHVAFTKMDWLEWVKEGIRAIEYNSEAKQ